MEAEIPCSSGDTDEEPLSVCEEPLSVCEEPLSVCEEPLSVESSSCSLPEEQPPSPLPSPCSLLLPSCSMTEDFLDTPSLLSQRRGSSCRVLHPLPTIVQVDLSDDSSIHPPLPQPEHSSPLEGPSYIRKVGQARGPQTNKMF